MAEKQATRDINQIVRYLTNTFNVATSKLERAAWSTKTGANEAYVLQTEFAYLLHEIVMGAPCLVQKNISACNEYIDEVMQKHS